jgi:hypothetical protein
MRPSRFRQALTASLRRQKLNGFFIAIASPVWRGRTIHGCRSSAAPLQTSRPRGTRLGSLAPTRDRMRAFRSPRHHKYPQDLGFRDSNSRYRPAYLLHELRSEAEKVTQPTFPQIRPTTVAKAMPQIAYSEPPSTISLRSFPIGDNAFAADPLRTLARLCRVVHCR